MNTSSYSHRVHPILAKVLAFSQSISPKVEASTGSRILPDVCAMSMLDIVLRSLAALKIQPGGRTFRGAWLAAVVLRSHLLDSVRNQTRLRRWRSTALSALEERR